jgi:hypothetical protein
MTKNRLLLWCTLAGALLLPGCATHVYNTEVLAKPNNRFAIVSFGGLTSGLGMSEAEDLKMVTDLDNVVYKELSQSKRFSLVTPSRVKASRSYQLIKGESTDGMYTPKVAAGYKKFDPRKQPGEVKKLMQELKVNGVILVSAYYGKKENSVFVSGLLKIPGLSGGVAKGHVTYSVVAFNDKAEVIWQDTAEVTTQDGTLMVMGIANVAKLYPQLVDITQEASRLVLKNLDEKLGKGI